MTCRRTLVVERALFQLQMSGRCARTILAICVTLGAVSLFRPLPVQAVPLPTGLYRLHNHPDAAQDPPPYGLRVDELFNPTTGNDVFTVDFDAGTVFLEYTGTTIHIFGSGPGGRDIGTAYANDAFKGTYVFDFLYDMGVGPIVGDTGGFQDVGVPEAFDGQNMGTLTAPDGTGFTLHDKAGTNPFTFRLGDEDSGLGHRGFDGISGWGWLALYDGHDSATRDWIFTAEPVPEPGTLLLLGSGLVGLGAWTWRRRRQKRPHTPCSG